MGFDGFSLVSLFSSCAHMGALSVGVGLHRLQVNWGGWRMLLSTCGHLDGALCAFDGIKRLDLS